MMHEKQSEGILGMLMDSEMPQTVDQWPLIHWENLCKKGRGRREGGRGRGRGRVRVREGEGEGEGE